MNANPDRPFDIVLLGATGFTGELTARYLAEHAPDGMRWALAGRSADKVERVRKHLGVDVEVRYADSHDEKSLAELAAETRVLISTVGPYQQHGEKLVAACAAAGTDYVDLTGEPEFVDRMYVAHHATAVASGARLVHACGFDSIPHDLGALFTVNQLPVGKPITLRGVVRAGGKPSGGTVHSAINAFARGRQLKEAVAARRKVEPRPAGGRRSSAVAGRPGRDPELGYWLAPLPTIDPFVVARSGAALDRYGPDFRYSHYAGIKTLRYLVGGALGVGSMVLAAQLPPLRAALLKRVPQGEGPTEALRAKSWFTVDFVGESDGQTIVTQVSGGDPGYDETAKMLAESAMCLAFDDNPKTAGQVTTAVAMGEQLTRRLVDAGIKFRVL